MTDAEYILELEEALENLLMDYIDVEKYLYEFIGENAGGEAWMGRINALLRPDRVGKDG